MRNLVLAAGAVIVALSLAAPAEARRSRAGAADRSDWSEERGMSNRHHSEQVRNFWDEPSDSAPRRGRQARPTRSYEESVVSSSSGGGHSAGARPGAWCGWYMRTQRGGGPELNLASNWKHWGSSSGPQVGAVVVWPHHVGEITGRTSDGQWIVRSGNDGGRVRERARSVSGASFRMG